MKSLKPIVASTLASTLLALGLTSAAHATPMDPKAVAADAKWVVHFDVDAMAKTNLWKLIEPKLKENPKYIKGLADVQRVGKVTLPDDLHGVTIYGSGVGERDAVIVIKAKVDTERLVTLVSVNENYSSEKVGDYTVHGWVDKGKQVYGGITTDSRLVISQDRDNVVDALDTINGKAEAGKNPALAPRENVKDLLVYIAGDELGHLRAGVRSPVIQKLQNAWMTVTENANGLALQSQIAATDEKVATQVKEWIDGAKAMVSFAGQDDPDAMMAADAMVNLVTKADGKAVNIDWLIPNQSITDILNRAAAEMEKKTSAIKAD